MFGFNEFESQIKFELRTQTINSSYKLVSNYKPQIFFSNRTRTFLWIGTPNSSRIWVTSNIYQIELKSIHVQGWYDSHPLLILLEFSLNNNLSSQYNYLDENCPSTTHVKLLDSIIMTECNITFKRSSNDSLNDKREDFIYKRTWV